MYADIACLVLGAAAGKILGIREMFFVIHGEVIGGWWRWINTSLLALTAS